MPIIMFSSMMDIWTSIRTLASLGCDRPTVAAVGGTADDAGGGLAAGGFKTSAFPIPAVPPLENKGVFSPKFAIFVSLSLKQSKFAQVRQPTSPIRFL
jgi:hypothetical protein